MGQAERGNQEEGSDREEGGDTHGGRGVKDKGSLAVALGSDAEDLKYCRRYREEVMKEEERCILYSQVEPLIKDERVDAAQEVGRNCSHSVIKPTS